MDDLAITPDMPILTSDVADELEAEQQQVIEQDLSKAEVVMAKGWEQHLATLDRYIEDFTTGKSLQFDPNTPLDIIGQKYVIASTIATICRDLKADAINAANGVLASGRTGN